MRYDTHDNIFAGSYNGESVTLIIDSIFWRAAKKFMQVLDMNENLWIYAKNRNIANDKFKLYTIGEFLYSMEKTYNVSINQRFKGLGESGADILFASTLNPKMRRLIRFTIDDMKKTLETFDLLHARTTEMRQARRELLDNASISYMDLDN